MKSRFLRRAGSFLLALALACSLLTVPAAADDPTTDPPAQPVLVSGISLSPSSLSLNTESQKTGTITATVQPDDATDKTLEWKSLDETVATVSNGVVTAVKEGNTKITAKSTDGSDVTATCSVTVTSPAPPQPAATLRIDPNSASVPAGGTVKLTALVENAPASGVRWVCLNNKVMLSPTSGRETTVTVLESAEPGTIFNVEARLENSAVSSVCVIRVSEPQAPNVREVLINSPNTTAYQYLDPGSTLILDAAAYPQDAPEDDRRLIWTSSDESVAKVNSKTGEIRGVAPGKATIRATATGDATKYAERDIEVSGIKLSYVEKSTSGGQGQTV